MKGSRGVLLIIGVAATWLTGCGTYPRQGLDPARAPEIERDLWPHEIRLSPELEDEILALDPQDVTAEDILEVLSHAPAPRVVSIHGGVAVVVPIMISFCEFLTGMGYPEASLINPGDGTYTFSCYESSRKIAGVIAWYYEKEGLRPMMVGHSQGGMQVVRVLYQLSKKPASRLRVWNPLTWKEEERWEIMDPISGQTRSVAGLVLPYASVVGAGGLTRILPNQWAMSLSPGLALHRIPDSVEEFTGFCKGADPLGGDFLGYGPMNHYKPRGSAVVRNVWLPSAYKHRSIPETKHLLQSQEIRDWINDYRPSAELTAKPQLDRQFDSNTANILWAADVWHSIKKHWVLELQRWIQAKREQRHDA